MVKGIEFESARDKFDWSGESAFRWPDERFRFDAIRQRLSLVNIRSLSCEHNIAVKSDYRCKAVTAALTCRGTDCTTGILATMGLITLFKHGKNSVFTVICRSGRIDLGTARHRI